MRDAVNQTKGVNNWKTEVFGNPDYEFLFDSNSVQVESGHFIFVDNNWGHPGSGFTNTEEQVYGYLDYLRTLHQTPFQARLAQYFNNIINLKLCLMNFFRRTQSNTQVTKEWFVRKRADHILKDSELFTMVYWMNSYVHMVSKQEKMLLNLYDLEPSPKKSKTF